VRRQHPIRATFLDPRADNKLGAIYHEGVDIAVNDEQPERGAPQGRTHRVYAIEGGAVWEATPPGVRGNVRIGHFGYGHVDARVSLGDRVVAGQMIGWSWLTTWHVHLTEFLFLPDGRRIIINPLRPGGKLRPYKDTLGPMIHEIRAYTPATGSWGRRRTNVAVLRPAGRRLDRTRLRGHVDLRVRAADRQSFMGWFQTHPYFASPHHLYRLSFVLAHRPSGRVVLRRPVFWADQLLDIPPIRHFAPGTKQNLTAEGCFLAQPTDCRGSFWYHLIPGGYWDTTKYPNGRYLLRVHAWDTRGNHAKRDVELVVRN
jgi:hypothetical protein